MKNLKTNKQKKSFTQEQKPSKSKRGDNQHQWNCEPRDRRLRQHLRKRKGC